ncbi:MAG: HypC/HybG/HupF family hydrogenase formation chaperone [Armatimonadetes bacterium CG_4_10_14_3_um_filter_66_18]|nr:MAG: HypC/HybG/HupF family hydrogenase formation chaperone [Armatimonadetes bacterium CG_4_10_14_3_um_filter_66_18]
MCLAVPAKIIDLPSPTEGTVDMGGVHYTTDLTLVEGAALGDYVIVHAGFAIQKLDEQEAQETLALFREMTELVAVEESRQGEP